ncbi:hypothetical protein AAIA72_11240 [Hahella sp. SMD15-11]|uniref:Apea-like HEPN domain-containing protein n=1 Tax=Thermohahella caldifontis TaxID=3142973 RepID=A0AB39UT20_9GAMM
MQITETIQLEIGNAIPHGTPDETRRAVDLWKEVDGWFDGRPFKVENPISGAPEVFRISLDAAPLIGLMERALNTAGSFDAWRLRHAQDETVPLTGHLNITVEVVEGSEAPYSRYHAAAVFIQTLLLGVNLSQPGACQFLATRFVGKQAHRFEAQDFDSKAFYDGMQSARENGWPKIDSLPFSQVWTWLEQIGASEKNTVIKDINKVLVDMLKIAQQRYRYGARTAMLVANQLEMLMNTKREQDMTHLRDRVSLVLGQPTEAADCFNELHRLREALFHGDHPVRRPALVYHDADEEVRQQLAQHNSGVEKAIAVVLALVQDLIRHRAECYRFSETMSRG